MQGFATFADGDGTFYYGELDYVGEGAYEGLVFHGDSAASAGAETNPGLTYAGWITPTSSCGGQRRVRTSSAAVATARRRPVGRRLSGATSERSTWSAPTASTRPTRSAPATLSRTTDRS